MPNKDYVWSESSSNSSSRPSSPAAADDAGRAGGTGSIDEVAATADEKHVDALSMLKLAGYPVSTRLCMLLK